MDDSEIDLRPYIMALLKNKWWIIGLGLLLAATALLITLLTPRTYTANATLLLTRSRTMLSLAEQFPTVNEPVDTRSRMDALMTIAEGDAIANMTLQSLGDAIPEEYQSLEDIKGIIEIRNNGDSISVSASTKDPQLSANIANTWADHLVETINIAYSGEQPLSKLQDRLSTAEEEHNKAQAALENFILENLKKELETRLAEANTLISSYGNEQAVQMTFYLNRKRSMEELQQQAAALKRQLEKGNRSDAGNIGDALAVILARMNSVLTNNATASNTTPSSNLIPQQNATINLQIDGDFPADGTAGYSSDIETIIQLAEEEKNKAEENIQRLIQEVINPDTTRAENITSTAAKIQALEQQIEAAKAKELELTSKRDLAWEAYQALAQKVTEIKNATLTNNQVTLASQAIMPKKPDPRGAAQNTLIAGMVGILIGVIFVVGLHWWRNNNITPPAE
jgi:capsular polysaccharide biosynthesis protein/polyhydroxyalkanoate synthesis regulator phasin